jgi:flagellar hook-associated protein 2
MVASIASTLGVGSGIDTKALIEALASAAKAPKEAAIVKREEANTAKISALAQASSAIDGFASALSTLISGGTLFTQPTVSDESLMTASAVAGMDIGNLSAQIEVLHLATAQSLVSTNFAAPTSVVGEGDLTLTIGAASVTVTIDSSNNSLAGLAKAINDKSAGVTATVVTDANGSRLMLKGSTGEAKAFTLAVAAGTTSGLERFAYDPAVPGGMTAPQLARDAIIGLDGVELRRASNSFSDVIPGVQIDLKRAAVGSIVSLGVKRPTTAITQAIGDFVSAYNSLHDMLKQATSTSTDGTPGPLRNDIGMRDLQRQLAKLTSTALGSGAGPRTLAEIGVATNRDGTLSVNATQLSAAMERDPQGVEALFNPRQYSSDPLVTIFNKMGAAKPGTYALTNLVPAAGGVGATGNINGVAMISSGPNLIAPASSPAVGLVVTVKGALAAATITVDAGLGGALQAIRDSVRARTGPIASAQDQLAKEAKSIADDRAKMESRATTYYNQLVASFTTMDVQVSSFKATQSYLDQQIKIWNGNN